MKLPVPLFAALLVAAAPGLAWAQFSLPNIGNVLKSIPSQSSSQSSGASSGGLGGLVGQVQDLTGNQSSDDEARSGEEIAAPVFGAAPPWRNPAVQSYVNLVGRNLARQVERKDVQWRFAVLDTPSVDAMAFPGGIVIVTRGLYAMLGSEDELAAVLAHEIAHVNRKHQWKVIQQQKMVALAGSAVTRADPAQTAKLVADLGTKLIARGLDKSAEYEADRDGMVIAARAGYDSSAMITVMERLAALKPGEADTALLFSTHPSPQDRIKALTDVATPELERGPALLRRRTHQGRALTAPNANPASGAFRHATLRIGAQARSRPTLFYAGLAALFVIAILANLVWRLASPSVNEDLVMRLRLASPRPDPSILIVDVDERSLALMAPAHGRWPWPRSVIAEMVADLSDAGAKSIMINLTFSDPDKDHPQDDATFQDVLAHTPNVVLPITRLNPANDSQSQVAITRFAGALVRDPAAASRPVAVLAPAFSAAYGRLGFNNLRIDSDGAVRRFDPYLEEAGFAFPSLPLRALEAGGIQPSIKPGDFPGGMILNWRNKRGDYERRSFADVAADLDLGDAKRVAPYRGRLIIVGANAVGLGSLKGTAAAAQTDDNTILATAMDDIKSGTWLRTIPVWATTLLSILSVLGLAATFILRVGQRWINILFWTAQTGFIAVTIYFVSYTTYLLDVSTAVLFAASYYAVANIYTRIYLWALRGNPNFSNFIQEHGGEALLLVGVNARQGASNSVRQMVDRMERRFGVPNILHVDNLFDRGHVMQQATHGLSFMVVALPSGDFAGARPAIEDIAAACGLKPYLVEVAGDNRPEDIRPIFKAMLGAAIDLA